MRHTTLAFSALLMLTLSLGAFTIDLSRLPESAFPDNEASEDDKLDMADFLTANNAKLAKNHVCLILCRSSLQRRHNEFFAGFMEGHGDTRRDVVKIKPGL